MRHFRYSAGSLSTNVLGIEALEERLAPATVQIIPSKDNTLYQTVDGSLSNGQGDFLFVGKIDDSRSGLLRRAVLAFDVAGSVPAGATITSAQLRLNMNMTVSGGQSIAIHRLQADWGEGTSDATGPEGAGASSRPNDATWAHRFFNTTSWTTPGGDFSPAASATQQVVGAGNYTWNSANLTADVQSWLDQPSQNFGWIVLNANEGPVQTAKRFGSKDNDTAANRPLLTITFDAGSVAGEKFHDRNGNGTRDQSEEGLNGWTIELVNNLGQVVQTQTTRDLPAGTAGQYLFSTVFPGNYTVREVLQPGWMRSSPSAGSYSVSVVNNSMIVDQDFGNYQFASLQGQKWHDENQDGDRDGAEPFLDDWTVELLDGLGNVIDQQMTRGIDLDGQNGITDDERGVYSFTDLAPGNYSVREVGQEGWAQSFPANGQGHSLTLVSGQNATGHNFGNFQPVVNDAPKVAELLVAGTQWVGLDPVSLPTGAAQSRPLAWMNLDQLHVRFTENVVLAPGAIVLSSDTGPVSISNVTYTADGPASRFVATATLAAALPSGRYTLTVAASIVDGMNAALDGDWTNAVSTFPSGDGTPGGAFSFAFRILPGDANQDAAVDVFDVLLTRLRLGASVGQPTYDSRFDIDVNGTVNVIDALLTRLRVGDSVAPSGIRDSGLSTLFAASDASTTPSETKRRVRQQRANDGDLTLYGPLLVDAVFAKRLIPGALIA